MKVANKGFENVAEFMYLGMTVTNQNYIQKEIKHRLNSGNTCYHSVHNALYGCETWYVYLGEELRLRVFDNRLLRRIIRREREEVTGG
jgi:hypothetical protein